MAKPQLKIEDEEKPFMNYYLLLIAQMLGAHAFLEFKCLSVSKLR